MKTCSKIPHNCVSSQEPSNIKLTRLSLNPLQANFELTYKCGVCTVGIILTSPFHEIAKTFAKWLRHLTQTKGRQNQLKYIGHCLCLSSYNKIWALKPRTSRACFQKFKITMGFYCVLYSHSTSTRKGKKFSKIFLSENKSNSSFSLELPSHSMPNVFFHLLHT